MLCAEKDGDELMITIAEPSDGPAIHEVTAQAGVFTQEEIDCVDELWNEQLAHGAAASGYYFCVYRRDGRVLGFACYGPRALTQGTYDLFWIAVHPEGRRMGIGRALLTWVEQAIRQMGGRLVVVETSGLPAYEPTRRFYLATGYRLEATLRDFYAEGDDLVIFTKHL